MMKKIAAIFFFNRDCPVCRRDHSGGSDCESLETQ